jgi:hypothetical protein
MIRKGFWKKFAERAATSPYLVLLLVTSIFLSIVSFYTTYDGMSDFLKYAVFAAFVTSAIQSLLFVTSWRLGFMFADKEPIAWVDVGVFTVCFLLSVFFSFASLFDVVFSKPQQELASLTRVHNGVAEAITTVGLKAKERRHELVEELLDSQEYDAWRRNVLAVADVAAESKGILAGVFAASYERQMEQVGRLARKKEQREATREMLEQETREDEAALVRIEERRDHLVGELAALGSRVDAQEMAIVEQQHLMDAEERGVGETGKGGRGPVWSRLAKEQQKLIAARDATANLLRLKKQKRAELDGERVDLLQRIALNKEQQSGLTAQMESASRNADQAFPDLEAFSTEAGFDLDESVEALRSLLPEFARTLDLKPFNDAAELCSHMVNEMNAIEALQPKLQGLSCDRGGMLTWLNRINESAAADSNLGQDCLPGGENSKRVDELSFEQALSYGRYCLDLSGLPNEAIRGERREMDRLEREESPQASPFTKTTNALFSLEKLAIFALLIAVSIDLLVLFSGLIGARSFEAAVEEPVAPASPTDPPLVRTYKYLLSYAHAQGNKIHGIRYDHRVRLADIESDEVRKVVQGFLNQNTAGGNVLPEAAKGEYHLRHGFVEKVRDLLETAEAKQVVPIRGLRDEGARQGAATSPPGPGAGLGSGWVAEQLDAPDSEFVGLSEEEHRFEDIRRHGSAVVQASRGGATAGAEHPDARSSREEELSVRADKTPTAKQEPEGFDDLDRFFEPKEPDGQPG